MVGGDFLNATLNENTISHIIYDSRKISFAQNALFVALKSDIQDGHNFINDAYRQGVRNFLIDKKIDFHRFDDANFIQTKSVIQALQLLAQKHRASYTYPVIGITGSNGKTMVKEWLSNALKHKQSVVKSPQSYNSQLGVALSLLNMGDTHDIAIIEAGISQKDEMKHLASMIKPTTGILTNIGDAHSINFSSNVEKLEEKIQLFASTEKIIASSNDPIIKNALRSINKGQVVLWGHSEDSDIQIIKTERLELHSVLHITYKSKDYQFKVSFKTEDLIENCMQVISFLLTEGWTENEIQNAVAGFSAISSRLEIKEGIYNSVLINDSYSSDISSMQMGLEYLNLHHLGKRKAVIFSDLEQQKNKEASFKILDNLFIEKNIEILIGIGIEEKYKSLFSNHQISFYKNITDFNLNFNPKVIKDSCVLIKGARKFKLEKVFSLLASQIHETVLETNLNALTHNLNFYRSQLQENTKVMAVVKAEAYGSGSIQIAQFLENKKIDYLAVALMDEGIKIREEGCHLPIMIFNMHTSHLQNLWTYQLEPEVYSFSILNSLLETSELIKKPISIHIKIDSGMNRLGFKPKDIDKLISIIQASHFLKIKSIFSHLSASDDQNYDDFTQSQFDIYNEAFAEIAEAIDYKPLRHILNTAGIIRFPQHQYDMVRLGLGLYGIDETQTKSAHLIKAHTLKSTIIQIKVLKKGETTGYNRSGVALEDMKIGIVNIGYADGLMRLAGNGNYSPYVNDKACAIVGNICMDVCMIDISAYNDIKVGDEVVFFGENLAIENLATSCKTISYEILSRIAPRIKRLYTYN